jgi:4-diphosphocytidyl-2-C-methyl-D-erythritol kinase
MPDAMTCVTVRVPAKINLELHVGPLRPDGFHELATTYCAVSLYDHLTARPGDGDGDGVSLALTGEGAGTLEEGDENLAVRAARLLAARAGVAAAVALRLHKQIPVAAGLAGGSADAAAALVACDALWGLGWGARRLLPLAAELGSDVPFALVGGVAVGEGRGERLRPLRTDEGARRYWVLALSETSLATPRVFAELDRARADGSAPLPSPLAPKELAALSSGEEALARPLSNDLAAIARALAPPMHRVREAAEGHEVAVSGSGPSQLLPVADRIAAAELARRLEGSGAARRALVVHGPVPGALVVGG